MPKENEGPEEVEWDWLGFACFVTESLGLESKTKNWEWEWDLEKLELENMG